MKDYRKFQIEMEQKSRRLQLWRRAAGSAVCILESYREKRSLYFAVSNLKPSRELLREENKEYHVVLMGFSDEGLVHRDFGPFYVNYRGAGGIFRKFSGPELFCYTHCLLVTADRDSGIIETVYSGVTPFFQEKTLSSEEPNCFQRDWGPVFAQYDEKNCTEIFSESADETGCRWCRVAWETMLPDALKPCRKQIGIYGHYMIGKKDGAYFVGIPGRFLKKEQPYREEGRFTLWQPIRGGEKYYTDLRELTGTLPEEIFGYWIGKIDTESGEIRAL